MKTLLTGLLCVTLVGAGVCLVARADEDGKAGAKAATKSVDVKHEASANQEVQPSGGYLGIATQRLHSSLVQDVERLFGKGQGVLVSGVAAESPAEKAGIKKGDVVVTFGTQKIYSPFQLARVIQNDTPGNEVAVGILREGKSREILVKVGNIADKSADDQLETLRAESSKRPDRQNKGDTGTEAWSSFDSMVLERHGENDFTASIKFRDDKGAMESREFKGSLSQIRKDIEAQENMPRMERHHLLRALGVAQPSMTFDTPVAGQATVKSSELPNIEEIDLILLL